VTSKANQENAGGTVMRISQIVVSISPSQLVRFSPGQLVSFSPGQLVRLSP